MKKESRQVNRSKLKFIFCMSILCSYVAAVAQKTMLYPNLEKGQYDIGYRTMIDFDVSRTYDLKYPNDTSSHSYAPRPVIVNIWYPAKTGKQDKPMLYGDYIRIQSQDVTLKTFIKRIEDYNAKNSSLYMFYSDSLNAEQKGAYSKHLERPVKAFRNAVAAAGKFPLVIYHAGLGGTLNDNTILCEYLASHGFVVVSSSFQSNNYKSVNLDWDLERSTKDIDFMLNRIKNLGFIDFSRIAAIGHSYGAQAVLGYKTENFSPVSCLIILDTTMDYSFDADPQGFEPLTSKLYKKITNMNVPMMVFANHTATFKVIDSLKHSDRLYGTIDLSHNEFTSLSSFAVWNGLQKRNDKDTVWNKYTLINSYCLNYLNYNLLKDASAKQYVLADRAPLIHVYEIPKGKSLNATIPEYTDYSQPPSYLQFQRLLKEKRKEVIKMVTHKYASSFNEDVINNAGYNFLKRDVDFAIFLFQINVESHPQSWNVYDSLAEAYMLKGEKELAVKNYTQSIQLNPKNSNGKKMLEKLK